MVTILLLQSWDIFLILTNSNDFFEFSLEEWEATGVDPFARIMGGDVAVVREIARGGTDIIRECILPYLEECRDRAYPGLNELARLFRYPNSYRQFVVFFFREVLRYALNRLTFGRSFRNCWIPRFLSEAPAARTAPEYYGARRFWRGIFSMWFLSNMILSLLLLYYWPHDVILWEVPGLVYIFVNFVLSFFAWGYTFFAMKAVALGNEKRIAVAKEWRDVRKLFRAAMRTPGPSVMPPSVPFDDDATSGIKTSDSGEAGEELATQTSSIRTSGIAVGTLPRYTRLLFEYVVEDMYQERTISFDERGRLMSALESGDLPSRRLSTKTALQRVRNMVNDLFMAGVPQDPTRWADVPGLSIVINGAEEPRGVKWSELDTLETSSVTGVRFMEARVRGLEGKEVITKFRQLKRVYGREWRYEIEALAREAGVATGALDRVIGRLLHVNTSLEETRSILCGLGIDNDVVRDGILDWANWRLEGGAKTVESAARIFDVYSIWYRSLNPEATAEEVRLAVFDKVQILVLYKPLLSSLWEKHGWGRRLRPETPAQRAAMRYNIRYCPVRGIKYYTGKYGRWAGLEPELEHDLVLTLDIGHKFYVEDLIRIPNLLLEFNDPGIAMISARYYVYGEEWTTVTAANAVGENSWNGPVRRAKSGGIEEACNADADFGYGKMFLRVSALKEAGAIRPDCVSSQYRLEIKMVPVLSLWNMSVGGQSAEKTHYHSASFILRFCASVVGALSIRMQVDAHGERHQKIGVSFQYRFLSESRLWSGEFLYYPVIILPAV